MFATNFNIEKGHIDFKCYIFDSEKEVEYDIFFDLDDEVIPSNDAIACAISTLAGTTFTDLEINLPISVEMRANIAAFTKASIIAPVNSDAYFTREGRNIVLNFSGGFDSLAAFYLMPKNVKLVSMDFDGAFKRERNFFEKFHPYTLKTNFRQLKLDRNSWTFMGIGAILYAEYLSAGFNVFGTILEATKYHFLYKPTSAYNNQTPPFSFIGLKDIRYTNGLTEVGTVIVISHYAPELVNDSLRSLSNPKTEKRYRKETLLDIICKKFNRNIVFERTDAPDSRIPFGQNISLDFLCFYIIKNAGISIAANTISDIPNEVLQLANKLELTFYERLNCEFISGNTFPNNESKASFMQRILECGVLPYTENDYKEFREVINLLNYYHHFQ